MHVDGQPVMQPGSVRPVVMTCWKRSSLCTATLSLSISCALGLGGGGLARSGVRGREGCTPTTLPGPLPGAVPAAGQ